MLETFNAFDANLLVSIQQFCINSSMTPVFKFITHLGDKGLIWIAVALILMLFKKTRKAGLLVAVALAASYCINNLFLKNIIARTRPYELFPEVQRLIGIQYDYSFPSGHSASSFAAAFMMFKTLPKKFGIPALMLAALIGFSRLYVGVHYPSDVILGALSGIIISYIIYRIYIYQREEPGKHVQRK